MKNISKTLTRTLLAGTLALAAACGESNEPTLSGGEMLTEKERMLRDAAVAFVDETVVPTYRSLADASLSLYDACVDMQRSFAAGSLTTERVRTACDEWIAARKWWELSEAFLYGAAGDYNIDPHIDSWPLDRAELQSLLDDPVRMGRMDDDYAGNFLGYGLLGFHALEYMLFRDAGPRDTEKYTAEELIFTVAVAGDLRNQCIRLEASWAGSDEVTDKKRELLADADLEPSFDYGASMKGARQAGSKYKSYLDAAQEILQGCIDIADEVANQKIGQPALGTDIDYIESPYSQNSQTDFADNIRSIRNAYIGTNEGDASVSDYVRHVDPTVHASLTEAIERTIAVIEACPGPFVSHYSDAAWREAVDTCNDLVDELEKAQQALLK